MVTLALVIIVGAIVLWLLFRSSLGQSEAHQGIQADWRRRVALELDLGEHVQSDGITLGFDKARDRLAVVYPSGTGHWIPLNCIRGVETQSRLATVSESKSVTQTNRGSQIGGAGVGAVVACPLGAVVGGLSGSKTTQTSGDSSTYVERLDLKLRLRSDSLPAISLSFSEGPRFGPDTKAFSGGMTGVESFAGHLVWEVEKRAQTSADAQSEEFAEIKVQPQPRNSEGWWTATFGG